MISILFTASFFILSGCTFYELRDHPKTDLAKQTDKTIILHYGNIQINVNKIQLTQTDLTGVVSKAIKTDEEPDNSTHSQEQALEAHLYLDALNCDTIKNGMTLRIPLSNVTTVKLYDVNVGRMVGTYVGIGAGATAAAIAIIYLASKQSCPFVYACNGETYGFIGEIFSGAVYPQLERHDYLPLPIIKPVDGKYMLKITNEVKEIQHINFTEMLVVDHPSDTRVLFDMDGKPFTLRNPQPALSCMAPDGRDVGFLTGAADSLSYTSGEKQSDLIMDSLVFTFNRQPEAQNAKLLIRAKNSFWLDYSYGRFLDLFGDKIEKWNASRRALPRDKIIAWSRQQGLELGISVDDGNGWRTVGYCSQVGPMALRDLVVPLTLSGNSGGAIRVKLEFGAMFWEIDYAAIDYSEDKPVKIIAMPCISAFDQNGADVLAAIKNDDTEYYNQPEIVDRATIMFNAPTSNPDMSRTIFLHSKGYYDILRFTSGKPDIASLQMFKKPGGFVRFSNRSFNAIYGEDKN